MEVVVVKPREKIRHNNPREAIPLATQIARQNAITLEMMECEDSPPHNCTIEAAKLKDLAGLLYSLADMME